MASPDVKAGIVIIGGGGAGIPAAVAAVEAGVKKIVVLEKRRAPGGNAGGLAAIFAVESRVQKSQGIVARREDAFREAMNYAHWRTNPRLVRTLVDKSADTIDWLEGKGVRFTGVILHYPNQSPPVYHIAEAPILKVLRRHCTDLGVQILCQAEAKKLLTDERGNVAGVRAVVEGKEISFSAKGVIVATGGFAGNKELLEKYLPWFDYDGMMAEKEDMGIRHKGDGLRLVAEIGAAVDDTVAISLGGPRFAGPASIAPFVNRPNTLWVNKRGERFTDETVGFLFPEGANALDRQPGKVSYTLFDERIKNIIIAEGLDPLEQFHMRKSAWPGKLNNDFRLQRDKGRVKIANSWGEIARWIGAVPKVLEQTIDEYNSFCDRGHDKLFAKDRRYLIPLRTPPYYAIRCGIGITTTHGPIRVNHLMEVLNQQGKPIGGLYAAGVDIGGTDAGTYNIILSGHSFGFTLSSGRIAGENAARYILGLKKK